MGEFLKTLLEFVERFPTLAWRMGLSCLGLGAAVYGAIWMNFIRREAFSGYVEDAARIAIALGIGFFAIGTALAIGRIAARIFAWVGHKKRRNGRIELLLQNIGFLTPHSQLILYMALTETRGRLPSFGEIASMRLLVRYNLMRPEGPSYSLKPGHILTVDPDLYAVRDIASAQLKSELEASLRINLENDDAIKAQFEHMLRSERGLW